MKILIIDSPDEFPNIDSLKSYYENIEDQEELFTSWDNIPKFYNDLRLNEEELNKYKELDNLCVFSYDPNKINLFIKLNADLKLVSFYKIKSSEEFKESYLEFKKISKDIQLPKIKINSNKEIDVLELSELFKINESKILKYINGSKNSPPVLIPYKGMETFNRIQTFKTGVLVPARDIDIKNSQSDGTSLNLNENYIVQYLLGGDKIKPFYYSVRTNEKYGLFWTKINKTQDCSNIIEVLKNLDTSLSTLTFYLELEKHNNKFYINKINQGVHPYYNFIN